MKQQYILLAASKGDGDSNVPDSSYPVIFEESSSANISKWFNFCFHGVISEELNIDLTCLETCLVAQ
jgi:hypothetical protein